MICHDKRLSCSCKGKGQAIRIISSYRKGQGRSGLDTGIFYRIDHRRLVGAVKDGDLHISLNTADLDPIPPFFNEDGNIIFSLLKGGQFQKKSPVTESKRMIFGGAVCGNI